MYLFFPWDITRFLYSLYDEGDLTIGLLNCVVAFHFFKVIRAEKEVMCIVILSMTESKSASISDFFSLLSLSPSSLVFLFSPDFEKINKEKKFQESEIGAEDFSRSQFCAWLSSCAYHYGANMLSFEFSLINGKIIILRC